MKKKFAFSLVELLVVIAVIAIIAAIAVPVYRSYSTRSHIASVMELMGAARNSALQEHSKGYRYGASGGITIYPNASPTNPKYVYGLQVGWYGCALLSIDLNALNIPYTGTPYMCIMQCPFDNNGVITWKCKYHFACNTQSTVTSYLPQQCQSIYTDTHNLDHDPNF